MKYKSKICQDLKSRRQITVARNVYQNCEFIGTRCEAKSDYKVRAFLYLKLELFTTFLLNRLPRGIVIEYIRLRAKLYQ